MFQPQFTIDAVTDGLDAPGTLYKVKMLAVNEAGLKSVFSNDCLFALGSLPSQPSQVRKNNKLSSADIIYVHWDKITTDSLLVQGYRLYADTGRNDPLRLVYDGSTNPQVTAISYTAVQNLGESLKNSLFYRFQVSAVNVNGEGPLSEMIALQSCTIPMY